MEHNTLLIALQSSIMLGLLHGINPCGHSWLVLAPFTTGERSGRRVALLTISFLAGTALACLFLGLTLGTISQFIPTRITTWVEAGTSIILILLGLLLLYNPHILHNHDHDHENQHHCDHNHEEHCHKHGITTKLKQLTKNKTMLPTALFGIGFVNMIIPCPTAAVMYGYALNANSALNATLVFGAYAVTTAITVGGVIFLIFKATTVANSLQKKWLEPLIMRLAGAVIIVFSGYELYRLFG